MPRRSKKFHTTKKENSQPQKNDENDNEVPRYYYNPGKRVDITSNKNGGLLKEIVKSGTGEFFPTKGSRVFIHYVGFSSDNVIFYDTKDLDDPRSFTVGEGTLMSGIEIGVTTMRKGEIAIFTCKLPYYAGICLGAGPHSFYSKNCTKPPFGPQHLVYFKVELIAWKDADISISKDGGIMKRVMEIGEGTHYPCEGNVVEIQLSCEHNDKIVDERKVSFFLGGGKQKGIPKGIEIALKTFKLKEKSRLILSPVYAWCTNEKPRYGISSKSKVTYYVTLNKVLKTKVVEQITVGKKLAVAFMIKEQGSELFKCGLYPVAIAKYLEMLECLCIEDIGTKYVAEDHRTHFIPDDLSEENKTLRDNLKLICHLNLAACFLKLESFNRACFECDMALGINPKNEKGLYRRGQAHLGMGEMKKAAADFRSVIEINPNNFAAEEHLKICKERNLENLSFERDFLKEMFM